MTAPTLDAVESLIWANASTLMFSPARAAAMEQIRAAIQEYANAEGRRLLAETARPGARHPAVHYEARPGTPACRRGRQLSPDPACTTCGACKATKAWKRAVTS